MHPSIATPKTSFEAKRSRAAPARAVSLPMARLFRVAGRRQTALDLLRATHATVQPASETRHHHGLPSTLPLVADVGASHCLGLHLDAGGTLLPTTEH
jgi:hypothetical protein